MSARPSNPLLETAAYAQLRVALAEAERRITAYKNALARSEARARSLQRFALYMFFVALASLAFTVGVISEWL